jgi:hypothetical protein
VETGIIKSALSKVPYHGKVLFIIINTNLEIFEGSEIRDGRNVVVGDIKMAEGDVVLDLFEHLNAVPRQVQPD